MKHRRLPQILAHVTLAISAAIGQSETERDDGGNNNPTGVTGAFSGSITTGCSYSPYTGNAVRVVSDIMVPGSIGAYPLVWSRTYNSREFAAGRLGDLGLSWKHSYEWSLDGYCTLAGFPDGRTIDSGETRGIPERIGWGQIFLADGGRVDFEKLQGNAPNGQHYDIYRASQIIDPSGLITRLSYSNVGSDSQGNAIYYLARITEPGGRYLQIDLDARGNIGTVQAFDSAGNLTQWVSYTYTDVAHAGGTVAYPAITRVDYSDGTSATYTYQNDNSAKEGAPGIPLLSTCDDVRYSGPMRQIRYGFGDGGRVRGKLVAEINLATGDVVSALSFRVTAQQNVRVESRGDGPQRRFIYNRSGDLTSYTDFTNNHTTHLTPDACGFTWTSKDAQGHVTTYTNDCATGQVKQVEHNDGYHRNYDYSPANPYLITSVRDERGHTTYYDRDANNYNRVWQIRYPDGAYETFAYNNLGQVITHRRRNGYYEHARYFDDGALWKIWNPTPTATYPPSDAEPYSQFTYYSNNHPWSGRVHYQIDPLNHWTIYRYDLNAAGKPCAGRGLVTKITHVDGTYQSFEYDKFGNKEAQENELRQRTIFDYDDYSRLISVISPAPINGKTTYMYGPTSRTSPSSYVHTSNAVHWQTDPSGVVTEANYDANFRVKTIKQHDNTTEPPTTTFEYWPVGTLWKVHDPRNYNWTTTYTYDDRNRRKTVTDALNHVTTFHYDDGINVTRVDRPDAMTETMSHDAMNRVLTHTEPIRPGVTKTTSFTYWPSGRVWTLTDDNQKVTTFEYDTRDFKYRMIYPNTNDYQQWGYDAAGNLTSRRTVGGLTESFTYDGRNRRETMRWSDGSDWSNFGYDDAGRLTSANNPWSRVTLQYDEAGRLTHDIQDVIDLEQKDVQYEYDPAGKPLAMGIVGTDYQFAYQYDILGRLEQILNVQNTPDGINKSLWFQYSHDAASNETQRYSAINGVAQIYGRDELGRIGTLTVRKATAPEFGVLPPMQVPLPSSSPVPHVPVPGLLRGLTNLLGNATAADALIETTISTEQYQYDAMNRLDWTYRAEGQVRSTDDFGYDDSGQLTGATYTAVPGWNARGISYDQDNVGNRAQVTENGAGTAYTKNNLNQYTKVGPDTVYNGTEHQIAAYQGVSYAYRGDRRLAAASATGKYFNFYYDALGRCMRRADNGVGTYYVYDGARPIYEYKADGSRAGWNLYGKGIDEILLRADYVIVGAGQGYFYQQDRNGSVTRLTGFDGSTIESYRYDAFGQPTTTTIPPKGDFNNRFKFTGREYLPDLGIYDYRNRYYHPKLGRFLQPDPIGFKGGDVNLYRYCGNDPVNKRDPFGLITREATIRPLEAFTPGVVVPGSEVPGFNASFDLNAGLFTNGHGLDWGGFGEVMHYLGGGDRGGFNLGDGGVSGDFGATALPPSPVPSSPAPVFDPRTQRNIATLIPALQVLARQHVYQAQQAGLDMRIINGSRTFAEQDALYALGRTVPGQIVTNARGGESNHNFGTAYDIGIFSGTIYITDGPQYDLAGGIGVGLGLEWGGNWTGDLVDRPHFEYPGGR